MTRYQTYQMPYGWCTIDTNTESAPDDAIAGPFNVNLSEADDIKNGAEIKLNEVGTDVVVYIPVEVL